MILHGDCLTVLPQLPENSVHCVVTSPPYWALRDYQVPPTMWGGTADCAHTFRAEPTAEAYSGKRKWQHSMTNQPANNGHDKPQTSKRARTREDGGWTAVGQGETCTTCGAWRGCLGLEPTPELYIAHLVQVLDLVFRVLRKDGTCWLNLGDSYHSGSRGTYLRPRKISAKSKQHHEHSELISSPNRLPQVGLKDKDLVGIPWKVAFALRDRGWYLRSDIIWAKTNPMPESTQDRPTKSHEYLFLLTKSPKYYYDAHAIREADQGKSSGNKDRKYRQDHGGNPSLSNAHQGFAVPWNAGGGRNRRSVWRIPTKPFPGAHFATFPPRLVEPCILAGTSWHGCCSVCGAPFKRILKKGAERREQKIAGGCNQDGTYHGTATKAYAGTGAQDPSAVKARILAGMVERITVGWKPTCKHTLMDVEPCTVLDPFSGAGTTGMVAQRFHKRFIGIELGSDYVAMSEKRIAEASA